MSAQNDAESESESEFLEFLGFSQNLLECSLPDEAPPPMLSILGLVEAGRVRRDKSERQGRR